MRCKISNIVRPYTLKEQISEAKSKETIPNQTRKMKVNRRHPIALHSALTLHPMSTGNIREMKVKIC